MKIFDEVYNSCLKISSIFGLGEWKSGPVLASLLAFPILLLGKLFYLVNPTFAYASFMIFLIASFLIIWFALNAISDKDTSIIVLDKIVGMTIAFLGISLKVSHLKLLVFGFVIFHILLLCRPLLLHINLYKTIDEFPAIFSILLPDIIFGVFINILLRLLQWVMC